MRRKQQKQNSSGAKVKCDISLTAIKIHTRDLTIESQFFPAHNDNIILIRKGNIAVNMRGEIGHFAPLLVFVASACSWTGQNRISIAHIGVLHDIETHATVATSLYFKSHWYERKNHFYRNRFHHSFPSFRW